MENRVDEITDQLEAIQKGYVRWGRITFWILAGMVLVILATAGTAYYLISLNRDRVADIQQSRVDSTLTQCQDQNYRGRRTIRELDKLIAQASIDATPARLAQLKQSRASTVLLINALAPHRDCKLLIEQRFGKKAKR